MNGCGEVDTHYQECTWCHQLHSQFVLWNVTTFNYPPSWTRLVFTLFPWHLVLNNKALRGRLEVNTNPMCFFFFKTEFWTVYYHMFFQVLTSFHCLLIFILSFHFFKHQNCADIAIDISRITWLWRWLPLRLSKRQSPTTVLFRTTLTRTITLYELLILLGSNHLQCVKNCVQSYCFTSLS